MESRRGRRVRLRYAPQTPSRTEGGRTRLLDEIGTVRGQEDGEHASRRSRARRRDEAAALRAHGRTDPAPHSRSPRVIHDPRASDRSERELGGRPHGPQEQRDDRALQAAVPRRRRVEPRVVRGARRERPQMCSGPGSGAQRRGPFSGSFSGAKPRPRACPRGGAGEGGAAPSLPRAAGARTSGEQGIRTLGSFHYT